MCGGVGIGMADACVSGCVGVVQKLMLVVLRCSPLMFFETVSLTERGLIGLTGWSVESGGVLLSPLPSTTVTSLHPGHPAFHTGSGDLNSDPHACTARLCPQLSSPHMWIFNTTYMITSKVGIFIPIS